MNKKNILKIKIHKFVLENLKDNKNKNKISSFYFKIIK